MEATRSSETLLPVYQITWCHKPEDSILAYFNLHVLSPFYYYIKYTAFYVRDIVLDRTLDMDEFITITVCIHK
jgi:hypothetical protein